jgi:hypothetical protein
MPDSNEFLFFFIGIVGGGVQLGALGIGAANRTIVPAPGDYDDGEIGGMIGRGNRITGIKPAAVPLCPPQIPHFARTRTQAAAVGNSNELLKARKQIVCKIHCQRSAVCLMLYFLPFVIMYWRIEDSTRNTLIIRNRFV